MDAICAALDEDLADFVRFLFFSAWRPIEVETLQWRDYDRSEETVRLRPEHSKTKYSRVLPIEGELAAIMERRLRKRRLDCSWVFHRNGRRVGDFRKTWRRACDKAGAHGRLLYDLRRSGGRHLINAGNDPHVVMAFSGRQTNSMLRRYHIINLNDLCRAANRANDYHGESATITPLPERKLRVDWAC